jgi:hypothetical protein
MRTFRTFVLSIATLAVALSANGCKRPSAQAIVLTKDQEQVIAASVLTAPPADLDQKLEVKFEDKLTLLGYKIEPKDGAKPGSTAALTLYWRVDQPLPGDWKIFVHLEAPGAQHRPTFDHYGVGDLYHLSMWKKGEIIKDTSNLEIPGNWPSAKTQVIIGVYDWGAWTKAQQNRRLKITNAPKDTALADDRLLLTTIDIGGGGAPAAGGAANEAPPQAKGPEYAVGQAAQKPVIDGKLDEAMWQTAKSVGAFKQPNGGAFSPALAADVKLAWDNENLYLGAKVNDDDARNTHTKNDDTTWEGDVVELFLQVPGKEDYYELQWTPAGSTFDAHFTGHRQPAWEEAAKFQTNMTSKVVVDGEVNQDGQDKGWVVEAAIPWKALGFESAPAAGAKFLANLYRIDDKGTHDFQHMAAWAPVGGDFHQLNGAGTLVLGGTQGVQGAGEAPTRPAVLPNGRMIPMLPPMAPVAPAPKP